MTGIIRREQSSLSELVQKAIIELIMTEEHTDNKLPSEKKLADRFGVSVAVVREALLLLSEEGIVTKKQGAGNFFHLSVLKGRSKLYRYQDFEHLLRQEGYETDTVLKTVEVILPDPKVREALALKEGEKVFHFVRQFLADGHPAILCDNYIPHKLFYSKVDPLKLDERDLLLFKLFRSDLDVEEAYGQMQLYPYLSGPADQERLEVEAGRPMILMNEEHYSYEDVPISFSTIILNDTYISINMIGR